MYLSYRAVVILFFTICIQSGLMAQQQMTKLSIIDGLSNNSVRCIYQDKKGFMWFGTFDGLNRYDGYEVKVYRNKFRDTASLQHNYIYAISEDKKQQIWVGTGQGLMALDPVTDDFHWAYYRDYQSKKLYKLTFNIDVIKADSAGNLFIGTNSAGVFLKPHDSDICIQLPVKYGMNTLMYVDCPTIDIDKHNKVWLFLSEIGLCYYDSNAKQIVLASNGVKLASRIKADNEGIVWIGSTQGLFKYAVQQKKIVDTYRAGAGQLSGNNISCLLLSRNHSLYIGIEGGGVTILNPASGKFSYIRQGQKTGLLQSNAVMDIYQDKESRIWIATVRAGVYIIDQQKNYFQTYRHETGDGHSLVNDYVSSFCEYDKQRLWVGSEDGGVSVLDRTTGKFQNFVHSNNSPASLSSNTVTYIVKDYLNKMWVATFAGGVNRFNVQSGGFEHFECENPETGELNKNVWLLYEDSRKNLWAGTFSNGKLYRFNKKANKFIVFDQQVNDPYSFVEDRAGQLWCGNAEYLIKLDTATHNHVFYKIDKPVRAIYEDKSGNFWLGTEGGGLCLFNRASGKIVRRYTDSEGLSNNSVLNILEDNSGKLWLSTFRGITSFGYKDFKMRSYFESDGLQSDQFSANSALKLKSGELAFGGINGFNLFYPDSIATRNYMPPVVFTNVTVNNKKITSQNTITDHNGTREVQGLKVPYDEAILSFAFAGLEYSSPEHIKYAYYLEGLDKDWIQAGNQRIITYNNIREGNYTLHIRSTNALGKWNAQQTTLKLIITPPWFRTWWAWLLYTGALVWVMLAFISYRTSKARLQYQIKLERMNSEKEAELSLRKTSFFTHVSHEFRTPLMLIINPLQEILARPAQQKDVELGIIYRNARRLVSLIDQLLLFNKTENDGTDLQLSLIDFSALCRLTYESFAYQARNKGITYQLLIDEEHINLYGDKPKIEVILYNLLSNALRYTDSGGTVAFKLSQSEGLINVAISDTGYGIPPETGEHLFDKFYRSGNPRSSQKAGFGIGLYLVHQFVKLHKAEISYESQLGQGTTFFINFKKGKAHFPGLQINEDIESGNVFLDELSGEQELTNYALRANADAITATDDAQVPGDNPAILTEQAVFSKRTMLVIDDHPDMRIYLKQIFKGQFSMLEAADGFEGILMAREHVPDIIISDITMDGKSGLELCEEIKANPSLAHIPLILITANSSQEIKLKGIKHGADDYFSKPLDKELLIARIDALLDSRNSLQNYFYRKVTLKEQSVKISEEEKLFIDRCILVIENRLEDDDFGVDELAADINVSRSNLFKKIKLVSNQTPNSFIRFVRLRRAAELFINTSLNVNEVSVIVGFKDVKYFREQFSQLFGLNPSEYIKKYRDPFSKKFSLNPAIKRNN
jgi:signal transduction histidine kinase/ligand-binding sensor domain-containing protein/DNA-binding response OmpR family regulator